jgi:signal transduction histidine kinase/ActR/RegA family two-component response regulator
MSSISESKAAAFEGKHLPRSSRETGKTPGMPGEPEHAQRLLLAQERLLEVISRSSALEECLTAITQAIEGLHPNARAAVLLADETCTRMDRTFASSIPPAFGDSMRGAPINDLMNGPCGSAIHRGETVAYADIAGDGWSRPWRDLCLAHGVRAAHVIPIFGTDHRPMGVLFICFDEPHEPDAWELAIGRFGSHMAGIAIERERSTQTLRIKEAALEREMASARLLQELSAQLVEEQEFAGLYERILDGAVALLRADYASMQMLHPERGSAGELRLLGFRGFNPQAAQFWEWVTADSASTCGVALRTRKRVVVEDVDQCDFMSGTEDQATYRQTGIRAVQSTPLISRTGRVLGMISTHWSRPHRPSEDALRLFDILARQAADLIERKQSQEKLEIADRQKDEFLAMLAHELRNPLAPVRNASEVLARMFADEPHAQVPIDIIKRQTAHLTRLVDDLLDVSRITQGRIELQSSTIDIAAVVAQAVEMAEPHVRAKQHTLSITAPNYQPLYVSGDPARLVQCVGNILSNATKYTESGGQIRLETRAEGGSAVVEITDTGAGIPPALLPRVFDLFVQSDRALDRAQGGLGIGLAIVKRLVEMHGGQVSARSPGLGQGSTFQIRLPCVARPQLPIAEMPTYKGPPRRILIVDDNADAASSLAMLLRMQGHETHTARSGKEALERIQSFKPDVALLDLGLPETDGYELAHQLRASPNLNGIRLVALTGYGRAEDRRRTHAAGFDDHLVKPVDLTMLERTLAAGGGNLGLE